MPIFKSKVAGLIYTNDFEDLSYFIPPIDRALNNDQFFDNWGWPF